MAESKTQDELTSGGPSRTKPKKSSHDVLLRSLPVSPRHFWKTSLEEQLSLTQFDLKTSANFKRPMPGNEMLTMALNEIAVSKGRGYFFHLLCREGWTSWPNEDMHPKSRVPELPGHQVPAIVYMNYVWSQEATANYLAESHRGRYLKCDFMINPPQDITPLYAIQYVSHNNQALYATPTDSLILVTTKSSFYLVKNSTLEKLNGRWPSKKRSPRGPNPEQRLNTVPFLWDNNKDTEKAAALQSFQKSSLEEVYESVVAQCLPMDLKSTFSAIQLRGLIPRPVAPDMGLPLGTPDVDENFKSADPPSRRGETHASAPRTKGKAKKRKIGEITEET